MKCPNCGSDEIQVDWNVITLAKHWKDPLAHVNDFVMSGDPYCADCGAELDPAKVFPEN